MEGVDDLDHRHHGNLVCVQVLLCPPETKTRVPSHLRSDCDLLHVAVTDSECERRQHDTPKDLLRQHDVKLYVLAEFLRIGWSGRVCRLHHHQFDQQEVRVSHPQTALECRAFETSGGVQTELLEYGRRSDCSKS